MARMPGVSTIQPLFTVSFGVRPVIRFAIAIFRVVLMVVFASNATQLHAAELKAGVARVDLTPPLRMKSPLGGYGERMNRPAEGVHDRIFAKALVVSDGQKKFAIVTCDMLGLAPPMKPAIVERLSKSG